jgi:ankyrin repeat protein
MAKQISNRKPRAPSIPRMTRPEEMKTKSYVYGVDKLNGYDAWAMFEACAGGDLMKVKALLTRDKRLVNAQYWYQFPIHMAVFAGNAQIVKLLLDQGADPGQSVYTYNSWDKLILGARERGHRQIETLLERAMRKRFNYVADFELLKAAIIARDSRKIDAVLRRQPHLVRASDALGNSALHWSVLTRQLGLIKRFVDLGTPIDARRADGQTPVLLAVNGSDYWYRATRGRSHPSLRDASVMVGSLLAQGAEYTISVAAAVGDQERVEQLLRKDAGLAMRRDSSRVSPMSYAARHGHLHIVRVLLKHGADPNLPEEAEPHGRPLFEACCENHLEIAQLLLEHGANPNAGTDSNECCLTIGRICHGDRAKPLEQLLRRYGAYTPPYRMSVRQMKQAIRDGHELVGHEEFLGCVIRGRDAELLDLWLDSDPTVVKRMDHRGVVTQPTSLAWVRKLLSRGLDPNRTDWLGRTLLHDCAEHGDRSSAAVLLDAGVDINAREVEFQGTPLAAAVRAYCYANDPEQKERQRSMVEFLLERGAATNLPGDNPWTTPMAWATRYGKGYLVELLRQAR